MKKELEQRIKNCINSKDVFQYCWIARSEGKRCKYQGEEASMPIYKEGYNGHRLTYYCKKLDILGEQATSKMKTIAHIPS